jgi:hypothetical protein
VQSWKHCPEDDPATATQTPWLPLKSVGQLEIPGEHEVVHCAPAGEPPVITLD